MPKLDAETMRSRRRRIIDAAMRQFARNGIGGTSVDGICAEAGISKGALYTHFPSKEAIVLATLGDRARVYDGIEADDLAGLEEVIFDLLLRGLTSADSRLEMEAVTIGASQEAVKEALEKNADRFLRRTREVIETLLANKKIRMAGGATPEEVAKLIFTYALGRLSLQIYEPANLDAESRRGLHLLLHGLLQSE